MTKTKSLQTHFRNTNSLTYNEIPAKDLSQY